MYSSIAALCFLGFALAWSALHKAGIASFDWYVSQFTIGVALIAFWLPERRRHCPPLSTWLIWTVRGLLLYLVVQVIPLPLAIIKWISPARAELTRVLPHVAGPIAYAPISVDPAADILWALTVAGCTGVFFLVRDLTFRYKGRPYFAILPLLLVAAFEAALGLLQVAGGAEQAIGSYSGRDHYCCLLELTLPLTFAFGLMFFGRRKETNSLWPVIIAGGFWLTACLLTLAILFSLSRAGWVDSLLSLLLLAILVLFPKFPSTGLRFGALLGLFVLATFIFVFVSPAAMLTRLVGTLTPGAEARISVWRELVPLLSQYCWVGAGLMGFDPIFLKYQAVMTWERVDFAHNDFIQYFIELGLIGFVPLMIALGGIVFPVVRASWTDTSEKRLLLIGGIAGMFALFVHSWVDFNLYVPANMVAFAWILGFCSALKAAVGPNTDPGSSGERYTLS